MAALVGTVGGYPLDWISREQRITLMGYEPVAAARRSEPRGSGPGDAIAVRSIAEEYAIVRQMGAEPILQSLRFERGQPFDVLTVRDRLGAQRDVWFAIGSFFPLRLGNEALGEAGETPFDLNDPEAVLEIKRALQALAQRGADPLQNADPIVETVWQEMALTGADAGAWDGPTSDAYVAAISRHAAASNIPGPYLQIGGSQFGIGIVGGPQPTPNGLEVIAGAVQTLLGGQPRMERYLAWRDGVFDPPSTVSKPPTWAVVTPTTHHGRFWDERGYTPVWPGGDPQWVAATQQIDQHLVDCWRQLEALQNATEQQRWLAIYECIRPQRRAHHQAALQANKGAPEPTCPTGQNYDKTLGRCRGPGTIDLPVVELTDENCVQVLVGEGIAEDEARRVCGQPSRAAFGAFGAVALGAVAGLGLWYWQSRRRPRRR